MRSVPCPPAYGILDANTCNSWLAQMKQLCSNWYTPTSIIHQCHLHTYSSGGAVAHMRATTGCNNSNMPDVQNTLAPTTINRNQQMLLDASTA